MPKYDYACTFCDNTVEVERKITEDEVVPRCYLCDSPTKRVFSATPGHFKGQGWGKTYRVHKPKGEK